MEYIVFGFICVIFIIFLLIQEIYRNKKMKKKYIENLRKNFGNSSNKEYKIERFIKIPSYYLKHCKEDSIDDITWNDLGMDEIFKKIDFSISSTGEEYLYYMLRTTRSEEERIQLENLIEFFTNEEKIRIEVQMLMKKLGTTGKYSLYDYIEYLQLLGYRSNKKEIILNLLFLLGILLHFIQFSYGLILMSVVAVYNIITYFKVKGEIEPYLTSFSYITRLIHVSEEFTSIKIIDYDKEMLEIKAQIKKLSKIKKGSIWLGNSRGTGSGNPLDIVFDYFKMVLHIDLISFNLVQKEILENLEGIDALVSSIGWIESVISIAHYRMSLSHGWSEPCFLKINKLNVENIYHPLIEEPIKNTIQTKSGILLTGSNASGKSTFLKTIGVNALLAQSIQTVLADKYEGPIYYICSSMALKDDLINGESYYMAEIKSLKRILDYRKYKSIPILCFVDEVLRGTNTIERIAASTQILKSLIGEDIVCFAATHDVELTDLLKNDYQNYHFEEEINENDIHFSYKIIQGPATTRNAIKLLEILGYDEKLIFAAKKQAEEFLITVT